ncbi:TRAP transporter small permease subunit [Frigidibacter sp. MR17.24]|uniref:TRAP transporter small permease subunit n=1 Tax=Frigidibacter sp. MR17.24 TaxID=3127345 RepID=UPI003012DCC1
MPPLRLLCRLIDGLNERIGQATAWLILVSILVSAGNALVRKVLSQSSNAWLELQWYLFATAFLLGAAHVLRRNGHVRIDIVAGALAPRTRLWLDLAGHLLALMPLCLLLVIEGLPFFLRSWAVEEMSSNAGGLPLWPVKALVPLGFALLLAQALSETLKTLDLLFWGGPGPASGAGTETGTQTGTGTGTDPAPTPGGHAARAEARP